MRPVEVGITADLASYFGDRTSEETGLDLLDADPRVRWRYLEEDTAELRPDQIAGIDALILLRARITEATLARNDRLSLIVRFGVGFDAVDLDACTAAGVAVARTPDGTASPMAIATISCLLAAAHRLLPRDRLVRDGRWHERASWIGTGISDRILGIVGLGNIGRRVAVLAAGLGLRCIAYSPRTPFEAAEAVGVRLTDLESLLRSSDFVSLHCPLTSETRQLINRARLALMKPTAVLLNLARGAVVDQAALTEALASGRLSGAALDVFEQEPIPPDDPLLALDNVILSPHAAGWTDQLIEGNARSASRAILALARGDLPDDLLNPTVATHPSFQARVSALVRTHETEG